MIRTLTKWFYRFRNAATGRYISRKAYDALPEIERIKHTIRRGE